MGRALTQQVDSMRSSHVHHHHYQRVSGLRVTRATLPRLAGSPSSYLSCRHAFSASGSPAASPDVCGRLCGRRWSRGTIAAASLLHCPMCKGSRPLESHGHWRPSVHFRLAPPSHSQERTILTTAAARGTVSSKYAPDTTISPGTQFLSPLSSSHQCHHTLNRLGDSPTNLPR